MYKLIRELGKETKEFFKIDYVIGEFFNGYVVYGKLYDSNGNLLGSLNFGVSNEDSYESK